MLNEFPTLIWNEHDAREFIQHNMWPQYIGTSNESERQGILPILVWPEQCRVLSEELSPQDGTEREVEWYGKRKVDSSKDVTEPNASIDSSNMQIANKCRRNHDSIKNSLHDCKFNVFRHLRSMHYLVGPGDFYGGHYTLYKSIVIDEKKSNDLVNERVTQTQLRAVDEVLTAVDQHSVATVRVINNPEGKISAFDLISFSRLQNKVAKACIIAHVPSINPTLDEPYERVHASLPQYLVFHFKESGEKIR